MLKFNKDTIIEEDITEDYIREYLKNLIVNETIPPIRKFNIIGTNRLDHSKKYEVSFAATAYTRKENGKVVRDYYSESMVQKILSIADEYGDIIKLV